VEHARQRAEAVLQPRGEGRAGEDLVEKQNAETGLMPVVANEAAAYGYEAENRHFVRAFLGREKPRLTFADGLEVVQMLMTAYQSAEEGRTIVVVRDTVERRRLRWPARSQAFDEHEVLDRDQLQRAVGLRLVDQDRRVAEVGVRPRAV
jgi:hypothetical protein